MRRGAPHIVGLVGLALLAATVRSFWGGMTEEGIRAMIRSSAQVSASLFLVAFSASSLRALWKRPFAAWLLARRRAFGLGFALAHGVHLIFLGMLAALYPDPFLPSLVPVRVAFGALGYGLIAAMSITSFEGPRRAIGPVAWKRLHTFGAFYVFVLFVVSYVPRAAADVAYLPLATLLAAVLSLRIAAELAARRERRASLDLR